MPQFEQRVTSYQCFGTGSNYTVSMAADAGTNITAMVGGKSQQFPNVAAMPVAVVAGQPSTSVAFYVELPAFKAQSSLRYQLQLFADQLVLYNMTVKGAALDTPFNPGSLTYEAVALQNNVTFHARARDQVVRLVCDGQLFNSECTFTVSVADPRTVVIAVMLPVGRLGATVESLLVFQITKRKEEEGGGGGGKERERGGGGR